jgi:hypothetical protein
MTTENIFEENTHIKEFIKKDVNEELKVIKFAEGSNHREIISQINSFNKQQEVQGELISQELQKLI